jgi:phosphoribosyl 1,2-cyclic phosphodiesterase
MQLKVLGCSGGIGGSLRTTSFLLDHDILIDAGTGVGDLTLTELQQIDHIFVTHSHLDHVACIPFLVDTVGGMRDAPITLHAAQDTLAILRAQLFNWKIRPDYAQIPSQNEP